MEDFQALGGAGGLTVVVQNTGTVTSEYSVSYCITISYTFNVKFHVCFNINQLSIGQCSEGIIQVSEKSKTIDPRQQKTFVFEISASLNIDFDHNCSSKQTEKISHTIL